MALLTAQKPHDQVLFLGDWGGLPRRSLRQEYDVLPDNKALQIGGQHGSVIFQLVALEVSWCRWSSIDIADGAASYDEYLHARPGRSKILATGISLSYTGTM